MAASTTATSTVQTFLMDLSGSTPTKLVDITNYPDLMGTPEKLDATTLSDTQRKNILGLKDGNDMEFEILYIASEFNTLNSGGATVKSYAVYFGADGSGNPDGHDGIFTFSGTYVITPTGGGVNEVRKGKITFATTSDVVFSLPV